jgi:hypothetical protein
LKVTLSLGISFQTGLGFGLVVGKLHFLISLEPVVFIGYYFFPGSPKDGQD